MVFSLSVEEELKNKPFLAKKGLVRSLSAHIKQITKACDLPVIYYDESKQYGATFGAKYSNALQDVYNLGYDAIITIGTDSPHLEARHILKAKEGLLNDNAVIGPTFDGGYYLLGIAKEDFDYNTFLNFSWNTETVYNEMSQVLTHKKCNTIVLQKLWDIDHFYDINTLSLKNLNNVLLSQVIQSIRTSNENNSRVVHSYIPLLIHRIPFNKGSPLLTSI